MEREIDCRFRRAYVCIYVDVELIIVEIRDRAVAFRNQWEISGLITNLDFQDRLVATQVESALRLPTQVVPLECRQKALVFNYTYRSGDGSPPRGCHANPGVGTNIPCSDGYRFGDVHTYLRVRVQRDIIGHFDSLSILRYNKL